MKLLHSFEEFEYGGPVVITQGTFDGVHVGHQKILRTISDAASKIEGKTVLLTFYPHPRLVLYPEDNQLKLLTTLEEKAELLDSFGIDYLIVLPFTKEFSRLTPLQFIQKIAERIQIQLFVIGYDHRFGRNREGSISDIEKLSKKFNYKVLEISEQDVDDCIISSSKIRSAILEGDVELAATYLKRNFNLKGSVVKGSQRGHELGYPTANIRLLDNFKIIPHTGVYAVKVKLKGDRYYNGMMNIGFNPTFGNNDLSLEVHIFDFTRDLYGQEIQVEFVARMRKEIKFADIGSLKNQLAIDEEQVRLLLEQK